jgi:hypothetical protein
METLADALVEAVMFIAYRDYGDEESVEEYETADVEALERIAGLLNDITLPEKEALEAAVGRALAQLPPDSELAPYYRAWMENMFPIADEDE